jgi:hypothetical protein
MLSSSGGGGGGGGRGGAINWNLDRNLKVRAQQNLFGIYLTKDKCKGCM